MNAKLVNTAADVINAALTQNRTAAGIAFALDAAGFLTKPTPPTVYQASHDSIVMGLYATRDAAREHCETYVRREEPAGSIRSLSWWTEDVADDEATYELHLTPSKVGELIRGTGYLVTPLEVATAYDAEADE